MDSRGWGQDTGKGSDGMVSSDGVATGGNGNRPGCGRKDGRPAFTVPIALSIMVFFALCAQCMPTLAVIRRETGALAVGGVYVRVY